MATISEALTIALEHHRAGRLELAEEIYRRILAVEPNHPDALHRLGVIAHQVGKHELAIEHIEQAIRLNGIEPVFHNNLGAAYRALGMISKAVACYRRALDLKPNYADAHNNLGNALLDLGEVDEAVACYRRALELEADFAEAHNNLGNALRELGKLDEAIASCRRALEFKADYAEAHYNLGSAFHHQRNLDEAVPCYRRALQHKPDYVEAYNNLGIALKDLGKCDEAIACYRRALEVEPDFTEAHNNLGNTLKDQGRLDEAIACYRHALELKPDSGETHSNLGDALRTQGRLEEAIASCRRAVELKPGSAGTHNNLAATLKDLGSLGEAIACYRHALELQPDFAAGHSNLLHALQYHDGATLAALAEAHQEFERRHAAPLRNTWCRHANVRDPHRRLRLGFLSPDFGRHPVGYFLIPVLESLDRQHCETTCYHDHPIRDDLTARFQAAASSWRNVCGRADEQLAQQIRADQIDILFDLAGHTAGNRLLVFARKPAPVQITWIGYEGTTGLTAIDHILADRHMIPVRAEPYYREQALRMPDAYVCFDPPLGGPQVGPLPAQSKGYVTFGSFNNLTKIGPQVVEVWADTLRRVPRSQLVMKYRGLGDEMVRRQYLDRFTALGVEPNRLVLLPPSSRSDYLADYDHIDIALDPFPFSGSATTCDALWMGVPVVTCPGETFASRHGLTHLSNVGLADGFVARDLAEYVELAVRWANDLDCLAEVRASLRDRMAASPLCDGKRFAAHLLALLRKVWQRWCETAGAGQ